MPDNAFTEMDQKQYIFLARGEQKAL